jgi:hypothetical protein
MGTVDSGLSVVRSGSADSSSKGWQAARADTPLAEAVLPERVDDITRLREYYAGKDIDGELLVPCPEFNWLWRQYRHCAQCPGHPHCILDFLLSPQMLAPLEVSCG